MAFPNLSWSHFVALCTGTLDGNPAVPVSAANPLPVSNAVLSGATATTRLLSAAATDNATNVKASAGTLVQVKGYNDSVAARWLKLYDKATTPASTDTPRESIYLPPKTAFVFDNLGLYAAGIGFRITTGSADNDTGALTLADILGLNVSVL